MGASDLFHDTFGRMGNGVGTCVGSAFGGVYGDAYADDVLMDSSRFGIGTAGISGASVVCQTESSVAAA